MFLEPSGDAHLQALNHLPENEHFLGCEWVRLDSFRWRPGGLSAWHNLANCRHDLGRFLAVVPDDAAFILVRQP